MKKIIIGLLLTISALVADNEANWPFACEASDLVFLADERYFSVGGSVDYPSIRVDAQTIQIDRKNKTIKFWAIWVANKYQGHGVMKGLSLIDYGKMKFQSLSIATMQCNGSNIYASSAAGMMNDIYPGSAMEMITKKLIEKYSLK